MLENPVIIRIKSTFCPHICLDCYWEHRYKSLLVQHKLLRMKFFPKSNNHKVVRQLMRAERQDAGDEYDGLPPDVFDVMDR